MELLLVLALAGVMAAPEPPPASAQAPTQAVEWVVEIYESPAGAPPPDVAGPQGKRLFAGTLRAAVGAEIRQFVLVGQKNSDPAKDRGISIMLTSRAADAGLETRLTVDTNLPFGQYDQKKNPVWLRSQTTYSAAPGAKHFVGEVLLAGSITPTVAPPTTSTEPSTAGRVADIGVDRGVSVAAGHIPGAGYIPSLGGLFNRSSTPKPRQTVLLFVVTASFAAQPPSAPEPRRAVAQPPAAPEPPRAVAQPPAAPEPPRAAVQSPATVSGSVGADTLPTGAPAPAVAAGTTTAPAAKPRPGPAPPQAPSGGIPLKAGVIIITALNDPLLGDHESIKRIASVNDQRITIAYAADIPVPEGMAGKPNQVQELRVRRTVLREDLRSAREYRQMFGNNQPDVFQGSTALGVSAAVLSDLKTKGSSPITVAAEGIGGALGGMLGGLLGTAAPKELDAMSKWSGTITRVATGPTTISVLVNGVPTALPVVHAKGTVGDDDVDVEFFFLDDPGNPISIKFSIGDTDLQVVRIEFPIDQASGSEAATTSASTTSAATIEQALKTSGTFDVYGIYFDFGSDRIKPESEPVLREIAKVMADNPAWTLSVDGHTDNIGGDAYNLDLSKRRAAAVKQALVTRYKSDGTRLQTNGFGASRPKDVNTTFEGRARNRRVELVRK